uniref:ZP domain-containing protein n=1 Tax=Oryzias melastigma TaxID=30732 RepID=A0A3B3B7F3_ORYME
MLRPLLFLFAVADASLYLEIDNNTPIDTSDCPITYYGQEYTTVYVRNRNFINQKYLLICFNGYYNPEGNGDCIRVPNTENKTAIALNNNNNPASWTSLTDFVHSSVSTVTNNVTCYLHFYFKSVSVLVQSSSLFSQTKQLSDQTLFCFGVKPGDTRQIPNTCTFLTCSSTRIPSMKTCGSPGRCDGTCLCTVTGPTVIDFKRQMNSVSDRCEYSLLHDQSTGFSLKANFLERRRRDVSFVDSLTLDFSDSEDIQLLQGHRVTVTGSPVTVNSSVQTFSGVDLSKDQTGVTASFSVNGSSVSVFFDGTTAQIYMADPVNFTYDGLCVDSNNVSSLRLSSDTSCQFKYPDPADNTINCSAVAQQCDVLKSAPFSSCNSKVDPQPYINACNETLCKYPDVDGLRCQFIQAYAKACEKSQVNLQSWMTEPVCGDRICNSHEFCGEINYNGGCRCREIFAFVYRQSNLLGGPTVCKDNNASLSLVGCLLNEKSIDYTLLHLNDKNCTGVMDPDSHMVTFGFNGDSCGTKVTETSNQIIYKNGIMTSNGSSEVITRQDEIYIEFSCINKKPEMQTVVFRIQGSTVVQYIKSEVWNYSVTMKAFTDGSRTQVLTPDSEVKLNQRIWVELETDGLNGDLVSVVTDSCWATDNQMSNSTPKYDLIMDGCANPDDQTVYVGGNGEGTSNYFSFNMFRFSRSTGEVYLHCKLQLCAKKNNCVPACSRGVRRRRSAKYRDEAPAFLSMGWSH